MQYEWKVKIKTVNITYLVVFKIQWITFVTKHHIWFRNQTKSIAIIRAWGDRGFKGRLKRRRWVPNRIVLVFSHSSRR